MPQLPSLNRVFLANQRKHSRKKHYIPTLLRSSYPRFYLSPSHFPKKKAGNFHVIKTQNITLMKGFFNVNI